MYILLYIVNTDINRHKKYKNCVAIIYKITSLTIQIANNGAKQCCLAPLLVKTGLKKGLLLIQVQWFCLKGR